MLKRSEGFTILEIAIVLTILSFSMALAYPSFSVWITNLKIRTATEKIQSNLQMARSEALRRNTTVTAYFVTSLTDGCGLSSTGKNIVLSLSSPAGLCGSSTSDSAAPKIIQKESLTFADRTTISATNGGASASSISFNGLGRVVTASPWISQVDIDTMPSLTFKRLRIQISPGGRTRVCDPAASSSADTKKCI